MTNYITAVGVQQFTITIASGSTTGTATINAVGSGAFILWDGNNNSVNGNPSRDYAYLALTNSTTITATRNTGTSGTVVVTGCIVDGDTTNLIQSVQHTTVTIASGSATGTATISSVTDNNTAIHLLGWKSDNTSINAPDEFPALTQSGTTLTATRIGTTGNLVAGALILEFKSGALQQNVQRISATSSSNVTSFTAAVTSVTTTKAICLYAGSNIATSTNLNLVKMYGSLTNATTFTVNVNTGVANAKTYNASVIEFVSGVLNSSVQRNTTTLTAVASNITTLTSINVSNSSLSWLGNTYSAANTNTLRAEGNGALSAAYDYIIQQLTNASGTGTSQNTTITASQSGSLIIVGISASDASNTVSSVTDNKSQTYSQVSSARASDSTLNRFSDIWYFPNSTSGVTTITVNFTNSSASTIVSQVMEVANMVTSSPVDAHASASNIASSTTIVSGNVTTTANNDFIFVMLGNTGGPASVNSPYTLVTGTANPAAYNVAGVPVTNQTCTFNFGAAITSCASSAAFLSSNSTTPIVTVSRNNATANITGSWEVFEMSPYVPPASGSAYTFIGGFF